MSLLDFLVEAMLHVVPDHDHTDLARAVVAQVEPRRPLFSLDEDQSLTGSVFVALLFRESTLDNGAIGDKGTSHCAGQIHLPGGARTAEGWSGEDLRADPSRCLAVVSRMLRASFSACRALPFEERLAVYARGSCNSLEGRRISRDRMRLAARIHAAVTGR